MRYFFDFSDLGDWRDTEGAELPDLEAARLQAARACVEWLREHAERLLVQGRLRVVIRDEDGQVFDGVGLSWMDTAA